jgi:AcrR family transcriptional regulator
MKEALMGYNFEETHSEIIENAKKIFLEKGYEKTNLRQICAASGVTNGAFYRHFESKEALFSTLVEPCVNDLLKMYTASEKDCFEALPNEGVLKALEISNEMIIDLIDYVYNHFEVFKLLIQSSGSTKYGNFVEELVALEVKESVAFFDMAVKRGIALNVPSERAIHMFSHCYFNSIFECVVHDYKKEETLGEVKTLVDFFNAGWKKILGV